MVQRPQRDRIKHLRIPPLSLCAFLPRDPQAETGGNPILQHAPNDGLPTHGGGLNHATVTVSPCSAAPPLSDPLCPLPFFPVLVRAVPSASVPVPLPLPLSRVRPWSAPLASVSQREAEQARRWQQQQQQQSTVRTHREGN
jgi:hypothetical protein